jgi:putrescine aminotransferase
MKPFTNTRATREYQRSDAAHHLHAFVDQRALNAEGPRVMVRGQGVYLWDNDGQRYLDGMSGLWCTNVGYGRAELIEAATRQLEQLSYYNLFFHTTHPRVVELSEALFALLGERYSHAVYTNSGSEANETLIRVVRRFWDVVGQPQCLARRHGVHAPHGRPAHPRHRARR